MQSPSESAGFKLNPGHTLLVTGPADIRLSEGSAESLGAPIHPNSLIRIDELRTLPILALDQCVFDIKTRGGGNLKEVDVSNIPRAWEEAANVLQRQQGVAVITGDVDSGKSSLCVFLANMCVRDGLHVGVIDADVGQADIGPATTISCSHVSKPMLSLQDLTMETAFFVGDTSPSSVTVKVARLVAKLKNEMIKSADLVLVNTDGWVGDWPARRFKEELFHEIRPGLVLGLDRAGEIDPLLDIISFASLKLPSSIYARTRSREERKRTREAGYRRFFLGARPVKVTQEVTALRIFDQPSQSILRWERKFRGFLVGLLDINEKVLGIGRVRDISDGYALVETVTEAQPRFLEVGNVVLSSGYEEIGYGVLH